MKKKLLIIPSAVFVSLIVFAFSSPGERYFEIAKNLDIFATLFKEVNHYYVDDVNPNQLMETGINAMLESLDPYTNYIPEDDIEDYRTMTTGQYGGIGALIGKTNGKNMILMPYEGFPAYENGLKIGDEILEIDGIEVQDKNTSDISKLLKGQAKTELTIKVKRLKEGIKEFTFERQKITIDNVPYYGLVNDEIGYIKLTDFTTGAGREVSNALEELKKEGARKIILDLRDNPGGLLQEAVNVSNVFVPKNSEIVSTKGKVTDWNKTYRALNAPVDIEIPLVVMTNSRSASAAEIVAGVVQDYDRGVLVGKKTFGKGLVQATRRLTYNSQLKVTTAKYYIPSGRCIQAINYSERNEDGSVAKIPDSLKAEFTTANGRTVYDGGGIDPDLEVDSRQYAPITVSLVAKGLIFDYATIYYYDNPEASVDPYNFSLSDQEYENFKNWVSDKDYDYTTKVEKTIEDLIENAKKEKYFPKIESQIDDLRAKVQHNKEKDLEFFKDEIKEVLGQEIVSRYHHRSGITEFSFQTDENVLEAVRILSDTNDYEKIIASTKASE